MLKPALPPYKKASDEGYTIVWVDEAGFYLLPHAARTWGPRGQTPALRASLPRDHLSAISGTTLDGRCWDTWPLEPGRDSGQ